MWVWGFVPPRPRGEEKPPGKVDVRVGVAGEQRGTTPEELSDTSGGVSRSVAVGP